MLNILKNNYQNIKINKKNTKKDYNNLLRLYQSDLYPPLIQDWRTSVKSEHLS